MGTIALLVLLLLAAQGRRPPGLVLPSATAAQDAAAAAAKAAAKAAARAVRTGHPSDAQAAASAAQAASHATQHAAAVSTAASKQPPAWPQVIPKGLPAWPSGWQPMNPVSGAASARAWNLLPTLWKSGAGTFKVEQTAGQWVTYLATAMGKGVKGVTAWTPKPRASDGANA